jgi:hypothetical protein
MDRDEACETGGEWMSSEPSKNPKASRAAAILFSISGLLFIIVFAIGTLSALFSGIKAGSSQMGLPRKRIDS